MEGWQIGLVIMLALGVAVILFGALWDRERNRRRSEQLTKPPDRSIPGHAGPDPDYLVVHPVPPKRPLSEPERLSLQVRLASALAFSAPLLAEEFIVDPATGWATLEEPRILICAEPVQTFRELLTFLDRAAGAKTPIVIVAPGYDAETRDTLIVNHLRESLFIIAVTASTRTLHDIAAATGATAISRGDLQSGWIPEDAIGHATTWVSAREQAWALGPDRYPHAKLEA